jgi:hypothetical protein
MTETNIKRGGVNHVSNIRVIKVKFHSFAGQIFREKDLDPYN